MTYYIKFRYVTLFCDRTILKYLKCENILSILKNVALIYGNLVLHLAYKLNLHERFCGFGSHKILEIYLDTHLDSMCI